MKYTGVLVLALLSIAGCEQDDREAYRDAHRTPSGFHLEYDGSRPIDAVSAEFDSAFLDAAVMLESQYGFPVQNFLATPHNNRIIFTLTDQESFDSPMGRARGMTDGKESVMIAWANVDSRASLLKHEMGHIFYGPGFEH